MDLKKTRNGSGSGPGFIKNPDPTLDPTRIKTRYPKLQKYPNIYIYSYNLTLTNPSFFNLQSSIFSSSSAQSAVLSTSFISAQHSSSSAQSTQSSVTPHASRLPLPLPVTLTPSPINTTRSAQSDQLSLISTVTPVTLSLSLF